MAELFQLSVVSADKTVVEEVASSVVAPGVMGYFGVLAHHEPFVTKLRTGALTFVDGAGKEQKVAVSGGFLEASGDHVIVLADTAERSDHIDIERAMQAAQRAKERLEKSDSDINLDRAKLSFERASNRLKIAGKQLP